MQQAEAERVLSREVRMDTDLPGRGARVHRVVLVPEDRLHCFHALGELARSLAEYGLRGLSRVAGAPGCFPHLWQLGVVPPAGRGAHSTADPAPDPPAGAP